ncbi:MAG TPA: hypothetical protein VNH15_07135 [Elusimicrobiota bacterium]|nr:hypothetical protein [Elusimicrobiota bacterium]
MPEPDLGGGSRGADSVPVGAAAGALAALGLAAGLARMVDDQQHNPPPENPRHDPDVQRGWNREQRDYHDRNDSNNNVNNSSGTARGNGNNGNSDQGPHPLPQPPHTPRVVVPRQNPEPWER